MVINNMQIINIDYLINGIVECAIKDYMMCLKGRKPLGTAKDEGRANIERFIKSQMFEYMTGIDGAQLIKRLNSDKYKACRLRNKGSRSKLLQ